MSLVKDLYARQAGRGSNLVVQKSVFMDRISRLSLSSHVYFEPAFEAPVNSIDLDVSGKFLVSGGRGGKMFIHDVQNMTNTMDYRCNIVQIINIYGRRTPSIDWVQWNPFDSGFFATSVSDRYVRLWDANTTEIMEVFSFLETVYQHHFSPVPSHNALIAVATGSPMVRLADVISGQNSHYLRGHTSRVLCCQWSTTEPHLLASGGLDSAILLWDIRSAKSCLATLDKDQSRPYCSNQPNGIAHKNAVNALKFSPDGKYLLSCGGDNQIRCWNLSSFENMKIPFGEVTNRRYKPLCLQVANMGDATVCFMPVENYIKVFDVKTGQLMNTMKGHYFTVNSCFFQSDRFELYSGGMDRNILFWTAAQDSHSNSRVERSEDRWSDGD